MSTPIGIVVALVGICAAMVMEGGSPAALVSNPAALVLVFLGTFGATIAGARMNEVGAAFKAGMRSMKGNKVDPAAVVQSMVEFADVARREGLLALEEKVKSVEEPFLKRALELVIDGSDPEAVEDTLHSELGAMKRRHAGPQKFWTDAGGFAPTIGIIGTVVGLIHTMTELNHPEKLGPLIGGAFLATLWGVMTANVIFLPIGNRLKRDTAAEVAYKELIIQGVLSIQAGASPRALGERLKSSLPPALRESVGKGEKKAA